MIILQLSEIATRQIVVNTFVKKMPVTCITVRTSSETQKDITLSTNLICYPPLLLEEWEGYMVFQTDYLISIGVWFF